MKKLFNVVLFLSLVLSGFSQVQSGYAADNITAKKILVVTGKSVTGISTSSVDSLFPISDNILLSSKAIKEYIDKRLALCGCSTPVGPQALAISLNPVSQTVTEGASVTFTAAATGGSAPYTGQWMKGTNPISGATSTSYTIGSTVTGDAGLYSWIATDAASATIQTTAATLTVNAAPPTITVSYGYSGTDPWISNLAPPSVSYTASQNITHNQSLSYNWPEVATNKFLVIKVPSTESTKTTWHSTDLNSGTIGDAGFRAAFTVGAFTYYVSREALAFEYTLPFLLQ